jgi:hypothetical protein
MGVFGHQIGNLGGRLDKMITKGNKLFALGNTIASASNLNTTGDIGRKALEMLTDYQLSGGKKKKSILDHLLGEVDGEETLGAVKDVDGGDRKETLGVVEEGRRDRDRKQRDSVYEDGGRERRRRRSEAG